MKIAIMGASGHVATALYYQLRDDNKIHQFSREAIEDPMGGYFYYPYSDLKYNKYDAIINCVGFGNPVDIEKAGAELFFATEKYDNLALKYLENHPSTKYIFISSGVVHSPFDANNITKQSFYQIPKLNAEAKHRTLPKFNIIDIRLFSFFTRYTNLDAGFFMSVLIKAVKENKEFVTDESIMIRDYINPKDLVSLIKICISYEHINEALDINSLEPAEKFNIIAYFQEKYNLKVKIIPEMKSFSSVNKHIYVPDNTNKIITALIGYLPKFTSLQTIKEESSYLL